jgi:hypothetical protein
MMKRFIPAALVLLLICGAFPSASLADGELATLLSEADKARLAQFDTVRSSAIAEAEAGADAQDRLVLDRVLSGSGLEFEPDYDPSGDWQCRTIKLGGGLPLVIYGWFKCRISDDGSGWSLEKTTGSQRTSGRLFNESGNRLVYVGAGHYADEKLRSYGQDAERDQVAYVVRPDAKRLRFEFPLPKFESRFDILELKR